jgi:hypothetical protein
MNWFLKELKRLDKKEYRNKFFTKSGYLKSHFFERYLLMTFSLISHKLSFSTLAHIICNSGLSMHKRLKNSTIIYLISKKVL